jgi:hypothetical protein
MQCHTSWAQGIDQRLDLLLRRCSFTEAAVVAASRCTQLGQGLGNCQQLHTIGVATSGNTVSIWSRVVEIQGNRRHNPRL